MLIGYARVSTQDQNLDLQIEALTQAGCKRLFEDKISDSRASGQGWPSCWKFYARALPLSSGIWIGLGAASRTWSICWLIAQARCAVRSLTDAIDTSTPSGRFFFHVMARLSEMERDLTIERTRTGLEAARQLGRRGGRRRQMTDSKIESARELFTTGVPPRDVAKNLGVSVPTLYRWILASTLI